MSKTDVAIACQGGGSHSAFTAGVLKRVLRGTEPDIDVVGLSGTSGGAMCALLAWYGRATEGDERAAELLDSFWMEMSADSPLGLAMNNVAVWWAKLETMGMPLPATSPYRSLGAGIARRQLRGTLEDHVDFDRVRELADDTTAALLVSTVDVADGDFKTIPAGQLTPAAILASAAVPNFFRAVELEQTSPGLDSDIYDGDPHWDGLFARNPPIREFLEYPDAAGEKPDEIWIVQTHQAVQDDEPIRREEIIDRRNELAGNLSLEQEVDFIEKVNDWLTADPPKLSGEYKPIEVGRIQLDADLSPASRFDRDRSFVRELMQRGEEAADRFLEDREGD